MQTIIWSVVAVTVGVSVYLTVQMIRNNVFQTEAAAFVERDMVFPNTQVLNHREYVSGGKRYIDVTLIGEALPKDSLQLAMMNKLDSVGLGGTILNIKQGFSLNSDYSQDDNADKFYQLMQRELASRQSTIDSLKTVVRLHNQFSDESVRVSPEVKVLFPNVKDIALSQMVASSVDSMSRDTVNMIFVNAPAGISMESRRKLRQYMEVRLRQKNIHLTVNPTGFPWPSAK